MGQDEDLSKKVNKIEGQIDYLKVSHKQTRANQDRMFELQGEALRKINAIHTCLAGTEYDAGQNGSGGGLVRRVHRLEKSNGDLQIWKETSKTRNTVVWTVVSVVISAIGAVIISCWNKIFS